ncbi:hypothetical protein V2J09_005846, partial [Rumex salicifolius]
FVTIDCGLSKESNYTGESTSLIYVSDDGFVETGINMDIAPNFLSGTPKTLSSLRSFPQGTKNCYTILPKQGKNTNYLIRATFYYGNYDSKNKTPEFDLHLGTDVWYRVKFNQSSDVIRREIIYTPSADYLYVCLANIGLGTPFISLLEIRHLSSDIYNRFSWSLELLGRYYTDTRAIAANLPDSTTISTTSDVDSSSNNFKLPSLAMKAATTMKNKDDPMVIPITSLVPFEGNSTSQYFIYLHFAEVMKLTANETREFNISINGLLMDDMPYSPSYLVAETYANFEAISGSELTISFEKTAHSTLPPIINALEYFMVKELLQALTNLDDVDAIFKIKSAYSLSKNWQGDPCAPQIYVWDGVNCSFTNLNSPIIITLDLSSSVLTGSIDSSFSSLTSLQILDLSNNSLTGKIPESLAGLPSLRILNLSMNKLTGSVPQLLLDKAERGQLTLSLNGNPDLCSSSTCNSKKQKIVTSVVASVSAFIGLLVVLGILFLIKTGKIAGTKTTKAQMGLPLQYSYNKRNRGIARYSYSEVIDMTKDFEKELGKGGFGIVYYGRFKDGTEVAVKKLKFTVDAVEQFETEIDLLMTISHKNLVGLQGFCDEVENLVLIYEYMANGDLHKAISGLDHLHQGCRPPIVHRDVKTCNILLNENLEAKVADFGISKIFPDEFLTHITTRAMGTPGYLDPEYHQSLQLKDKSDVYSFGVVLLELITGQQPIIKSGPEWMNLIDKVRPFVEKWDIWSIVDERVKDTIHNQNSVSRFIDVAMSCVKRRSKERPTMSQVVMDLKECLAMEMDNNSHNRTSHSMEMIFAVTSSATNPGER